MYLNLLSKAPKQIRLSSLLFQQLTRVPRTALVTVQKYRFPRPPVISGEYGLVRPRGAKRRGGGRRPDSPEMTGGKCFSHALASRVTRLTKKAGRDGILARSVSLIFAILTLSLKRPGSI